MPELPINIVGGNKFGLYRKISDERTVNMFKSDDWMVSFGGHKIFKSFPSTGQGRALFHSIRGDLLVVVLGNDVFKVDAGFIAKRVGGLNSSSGEVYIDENLASQFCRS